MVTLNSPIETKKEKKLWIQQINNNYLIKQVNIDQQGMNACKFRKQTKRKKKGNAKPKT